MDLVIRQFARSNSRGVARSYLLPAMVALSGLFVFLGGSVAAQGVRVSAQLDRTVTYVGDDRVLQVSIEGAGDAGVAEPAIPTVPGLIFRGPRRSSNMSASFDSRSGRMVQVDRVAFTYEIQPTREGRVTIPPIAVDVGGTRYETGALSLLVTKAAESEHFYYVQEVSKLSPFVQEPIDISIRFYLRRGCGHPLFRIPWLGSPDFKVFLAEGARSPSSVEFEVEVPGRGRGRFPFVKSREKFRGVDLQAYTLSCRLYPLTPGRVSLGVITSRIAYEVGTETRRGVFGRLQRVPKIEEDFVSSNDLELDVKPIPLDGQPRSFTGSVGQYLLTIEADPTVVDLGQPIDVKMKITGTGLMSEVTPPDLSAQPEIVRQFKISGDLVATSADEDDEKIFTQTLRVSSIDVTSIPAVEFSFFDPESASYRVVTSKPVPLTVRSLDVATGRELEIIPSRDGTTKRIEVRSLADGISELHTGIDALEDYSVRSVLSGAQLAWWGAPPLLYGFLLFVVSRRRRFASDYALVRKRDARKEAEKRLAAARAAAQVGKPHYDAIKKGICGYIGDRTNTPAAELSADEVGRRLARGEIADELVARVGALIEECDLGRFAGSAGVDAGEDILARAEAILRDLERVKL